MALLHSMESSGNKLFRYRGQIPIVLFIMALPFIYFTNYAVIDAAYIPLLRWIAIGLSIIGFIIRAIAIGSTPKGTSGRNTKQQVAEVLNTTGIYSIVRHPLYLGNYFMWIGIVAYVFNIYFVIIVSLMYWIYYERIMFAEERFLEKKFGEDYITWSMSLPAFWPSFKNYKKSSTPFSIKPVLRREYSGILATVIGFIFIDVVRDWVLSLRFGFDFHLNMMYVWVLSGAVVYALIFRSLKHYTRVLHEEDRS